MSISLPLVRRVDRAQIRQVETVRKLGSQLETKRRSEMKFMMIVKHAEKQGPPPKQLMDSIATLAGEAVKAGTMLGNGGQLTVTDGPFTEAKEVVGGYAQFEFKSKEEAVESAVRFMELHKKHWPGWEGETEVRQMFGPEDFAPKT